MGRTVLIQLLLFLAPFAIYALVLYVVKRDARECEHWPARVVISLAIAWKFTAQIGLCGVLSPSLWWARCRILDELEDDHAWTKRVRLWMCIGSREGRRLRGHLTPHIQHCRRLVETLPILQHDPNRPEDVLKVDADEDGVGGDDAADALRYLVVTKPRQLVVGRLRGL